MDCLHYGKFCSFYLDTHISTNSVLFVNTEYRNIHKTILVRFSIFTVHFGSYSLYENHFFTRTVARTNIYSIPGSRQEANIMLEKLNFVNQILIVIGVGGIDKNNLQKPPFLILYDQLDQLDFLICQLKVNLL